MAEHEKCPPAHTVPIEQLQIPSWNQQILVRSKLDRGMALLVGTEIERPDLILRAAGQGGKHAARPFTATMIMSHDDGREP